MKVIATKKIMIVPCAEKIWSKCSGGRYPADWKASACCERIMMASMKPRMQHHQRQHAVHDADALVVDRGDPLAPQIGPMSP